MLYKVADGKTTQDIASTEDFVDNTAVNIKTTDGQRCQRIGI